MSLFNNTESKENFSDVENNINDSETDSLVLNKSGKWIPFSLSQNHFTADYSDIDVKECFTECCSKFKWPFIIMSVLVIFFGFILTNNAIDQNFKYSFENDLAINSLKNTIREQQITLNDHQVIIENQQKQIIYLFDKLETESIIQEIPKDILNSISLSYGEIVTTESSEEK